MRWVKCKSCDHTGNQIVFHEYVICQTCRMKVIDFWTDVLGFTLGAHPWIDEFMGVETNRARRIRLESYEPSDQLALYPNESDDIDDNSLDILDGLC